MIDVRFEIIGGTEAFTVWRDEPEFVLTPRLPICTIYVDGWIAPPSIPEDVKEGLFNVVLTTEKLGTGAEQTCAALKTAFLLYMGHKL